MVERLGPLLPCLTTLAVNDGSRADLGRGLAMVFAASAQGRDMVTARLASGSVAISRSKASEYHAAAWARRGRIGLDIESVARVALNASPDDPWLADGERRMVIASSDPMAELACHWVLREAYGKALGVGLALPLDRLVFHGRAGRIRLDLPGCDAGWDFRLYRRDDLICAVAYHAGPVMPPAAGIPLGHCPTDRARSAPVDRRG